MIGLLAVVQRTYYCKTAASLVTIHRWPDRKLQFRDRQLQISNTGNMGAQNFNFASKSPKIGDFQPQIRRFGRKISEKKMFPTS